MHVLILLFLVEEVLVQSLHEDVQGLIGELGAPYEVLSLLDASLSDRRVGLDIDEGEIRFKGFVEPFASDCDAYEIVAVAPRAVGRHINRAHFAVFGADDLHLDRPIDVLLHDLEGRQLPVGFSRRSGELIEYFRGRSFPLGRDDFHDKVEKEVNLALKRTVRVYVHDPIPLSLLQGLILGVAVPHHQQSLIKLCQLYMCGLINTLIEDMSSKAILILVLLVLVLGKKNLKDSNKDKKSEHKTVVQANHYYSNYEKNTTYDINSIEKNKSLIFLLKHGDKKDKDLKDNPITISLLSGTITETCLFSSYSNMCGINRVDQETMKLKIECRQVPCELSWIIYQPNVVTTDGTTQIQKFVEVNQNYDHATIIVSCNDPNIKTFTSDIQLYTNSEYTKVVDGGVLYYLFDNQKKGYYFISTENDGARKCAHAVMRHSNNQLEFNKNNVLQDFLLPSKNNEYFLNKVPDYDFRIDAFFHFAKTDTEVTEKQGIKITLIGENGKEKTNISSVNIQGNNKRSVDFSAVFKRPSEKYETLLFNVQLAGKDKKKSEKDVIILNMDFASAERQEINLGETSYFTLNKGDTLNFKLLPEVSETDDQRLTHIFSSNQTKFVPSLRECKTKAGCEFTLQAKETGQGNLYFGEKKEKDTEEIVYLDFSDSITKKMRQGEKLYLKTKLKAKNAVQAVVNSPNVIIYAARLDKCDVVSEQCHEKVFNFHNPGIYELKSDSEVVFLVEALDNCEFTLTLITANTEYIELKDSQPFTYLFDDSQKELYFKFKLETKQDAHFNLIGPVDELTLSVFNRVQVDEGSQGEVSTDGYITFSKDSIEGLSFIVKVEKRQAYLSKYIHFTMLVSTKDGNVRLESGVSQFQTIPADETRDFVFEYEPSKDMLLNFYTHNMKTDINVLVQVSTTDEYDKDDQINEFTLSVESDVVDIQQVAKDLCKQQAGENCELFLRLTNKMSVLIDITVTLMVKDSIIELKDGIWNSYQINTIAENTNFYFLPKNKNRSITILYKSDFVDLKLMYTLWKTDDKSINPAEWPFPQDYKAQNPAKLAFMPTKFIHIDSAALKGCWPNCVLLISTFKDQKSLKGVYNNFLQASQFKIMATSNFIEIPQKQKIDVILKKDQTKHLLIDLKYVLQRQAITIFTYFTIGSVQLSGNVYEQSNPRCPTGDQSGDFRFGNLQTQISVATIKKKLEENDMNLDKNPYICILAQAFLDSKFSIEYASDDGLIKQLMLDTFYTQKSEAGKESYFQIDNSQQFNIKITRTSGFPYLTHTICKAGDDFQECFEKFKSSKDKEYQIADKMTELSQTPCEKCIFFFRIDSREASEVNIHVQSKYAETELIENQQLTDELQAKEQNKYMLTSIKNEEIIINIQIQHGDLQVDIFDFDQLNLTKKNAKGSSNIHIVIPPKPNKKEQHDKKGMTPWGEAFLGLFDYSTFNSLHMVIKSQNQSVNALYTVTYSSGQPQIYLQDGLISQYALLPSKSTKFLYSNPSLSKIYLHLSMADAQVLNKLHVKIRAIKDENDEDSAVDIAPENPNFKKKTPNPTMIMLLPANKLFQIQIVNPDKSLQVVTIGVNNRQIIYLPYNLQFPIQLQKGEYIYLVINVPFQTHLNVQFKKCDESSLSIGYTTSYDDFVHEEFSYEQEMGQEELIASLQIKTENRGSAYVKVKSPEDDDSLLTVKATFSYVKNKAEKAKAGNKGLVEYRMLDMQNAEVSFAPIVCPTANKACSKEFSYSSISSTKAEDIYAHLVCSSISFDLADRQILSQVDSSPISASVHDGKIAFTQMLKQSNEFVGIQASNNKTGEIIYYKPVEIMTYWGQISKQGKSHSMLLLVVFASCFICCLSLLCYRRRTKGGKSEYEPLGGIE